MNFLRVVGRLGPGTDAGQAQAELTAICKSLRQRFPVEYARKENVRVTPFHEVLVGDVRQSMYLLLAAVLVVLVAALANLLSLALVRASGRIGELSMRVALGCSRWQLVRQLTAEAVPLALLGGGLGWLLAAYAVDAAVVFAPTSIPRLGEVSLDAAAAVFVTAVTALAIVLLASAPLGAVARSRAADALRAGRGQVGDRWSHRLRQAMVVAEISAALVLVLATIVLVQNLLRIRDRDPGFDPDGVFQARLSIPPAYRSPEDVGRFAERLSERLEASPGVQSVGVISIAPLSGLLATVPFAVAGGATAERDWPSANLRAISAGYPSTVGTRLLQGRLFSTADRTDGPPVALVSAALVERFLTGPAVGQRLLIDDNNRGPRPIEVVGVLEDVRHTALDLPAALDVYIPLSQVHPDGMSLIRSNQFWMIRTAADPASFRATFLAHLREVDPDAAVAGTGTMRQFVDAWLGPRRFNLALFGAFALTAVLLAVFGLYGLIAYAVSQRTAEIGLRLAIGATRADVQRMMLGQAVRLGVKGTAAGLALAAILRPVASRMTDDVWIAPAAVAASAGLLMAVVLIAAWMPARRAARIAPTVAVNRQ